MWSILEVLVFPVSKLTAEHRLQIVKIQLKNCSSIHESIGIIIRSVTSLSHCHYTICSY